MKFLAVFVAILAATSASQWTIHELSEALQNPNTDPAMIPLLEDALNQMMEIIWAGGQIDAISVGSPVEVLPINPISVTDPISPTPVVEPASAAPLVQIVVNVKKQQEAQPVVAPVVSTEWTLHELSEALQNPNTDPAMIPLLEDALNQMMAAAWSGGQIDTISVANPIAVTPVVEPVSADPLVQIIVNVNKQQEAQPDVVPVIVPDPVILPLPVAPEVVLPEPVVLPAPVAPEVVLPEPVILPAPVAPEVVVNPIDVIAITAPIVNPVDLIHPVPVVSPVSASEAVGPIV